MFDANARYLPKGRWFFAKVHCCSKDSKLYKHGVRSGSLLLCKMRDVGNQNPRIKVKLPSGKKITVRPWDVGYENQWLVYEGCATGVGFIDSDSWEKAKTMVKNPKQFQLSRTLEKLLKGKLKDE